VSLSASAGTFTPAKVEGLGVDPDIRPASRGREVVHFWLQGMDQLESRSFAAFVRECEQSLLAKKVGA
jgi:hypothetical protein